MRNFLLPFLLCSAIAAQTYPPGVTGVGTGCSYLPGPAPFLTLGQSPKLGAPWNYRWSNMPNESPTCPITPAYLFLSGTPLPGVNLGLGFGCAAWAFPTIILPTTVGLCTAGGGLTPFVIPQDPALVGLVLYSQLLGTKIVSGPGMFPFATQGIKVTIQP